VALDPHKWLYPPLEAGCVLVRDGQLKVWLGLQQVGRRGCVQMIGDDQRTVCSSISVAIGPIRQAPTFGLTAAARKSPSMPMGAGEEVT